eukprot:Clim_evm47s156 gene=Clim_evmTU47s156
MEEYSSRDGPLDDAWSRLPVGNQFSITADSGLPKRVHIPVEQLKFLLHIDKFGDEQGFAKLEGRLLGNGPEFVESKTGTVDFVHIDAWDRTVDMHTIGPCLPEEMCALIWTSQPNSQHIQCEACPLVTSGGIFSSLRADLFISPAFEDGGPPHMPQRAVKVRMQAGIPDLVFRAIEIEGCALDKIYKGSMWNSLQGGAAHQVNQWGYLIYSEGYVYHSTDTRHEDQGDASQVCGLWLVVSSTTRLEDSRSLSLALTRYVYDLQAGQPFYTYDSGCFLVCVVYAEVDTYTADGPMPEWYEVQLTARNIESPSYLYSTGETQTIVGRDALITMSLERSDAIVPIDAMEMEDVQEMIDVAEPNDVEDYECMEEAFHTSLLRDLKSIINDRTEETQDKEHADKAETALYENDLELIEVPEPKVAEKTSELTASRLQFDMPSHPYFAKHPELTAIIRDSAILPRGESAMNLTQGTRNYLRSLGLSLDGTSPSA